MKDLLFDADWRVICGNERMFDFSRFVTVYALMAETRRTK